jgi:AGZA family xanthine/uracil permease-like MFS transporter
MENFFKLRENNTDVRTEIIAGITTFFTMAYIIFVNPDILASTGMNKDSVMLATCISAAIGTLLTGLLSNYPFAQAPGMGLNAFFAFTVVAGMGYTWQQGLAAVFISGIIFIIITATGWRAAIVRAIPMSLKKAIGAGIGLFIAFIGLKNSGIVTLESGLPEFGKFTDPSILLAVIGLFITSILMVRKVKGALFIGIIVTTIIGIPMGVTQIPESITVKNITLAPTFFKMDFKGLLNIGEGATFFSTLVSLITVVLAFTIVDMFDTIGTLIGTASKAELLDEEGNLPRMNQAMMADAIATTVGAVLGTSTVTTYVESGAGISEGGRTGLTAVVVAILFILAIILAPIAGIVPGSATAPALIIVGVLMMSAIKGIDFDDFEEALPAFATLSFMPFSYSIANGIAAGFIFYTLVKIARGKWKEVHPIMYALSVIFILRFALLSFLV